MFTLFWRQPRHSFIVFVGVLLLAAIYIFTVMQFTRDQNDGNIGAMLDDTWIHVRFAESISNGKGLMYNEGIVTSGATSPLWVLLLAIPYAIFEPDVMTQVDIAIYLSVASYFLMVASITGFGWWLTNKAWIGFAAGLLTVLTGRWIWMGLSGMETPLFTALCIISLWSHIADLRDARVFGWHTGILAALATLARPEAYLLAALIGFDAVVIIPLRSRFRLASIFNALTRSWRGMISYVLLAGSYPIVTLLIDGYPLPNTFRAKSRLGREYPELPHDLLWLTNKDNGPIYVVLAAIGLLAMLVAFRRKQSTSVLWAVWPPIFILAVLYLGSERYWINHSRYVMPAAPLIALLAVMGIKAIRQIILRYQPYAANLITLALLAIIGTSTFVYGIGHGNAVANDVHQLYSMHIRAGYWIKERTQPEAIVALNDVGAMVHLSDRRVLDLEGLVSPETIKAIGDAPDMTCEHDLALAREIMRQNIRFVGVFPWFYPCLTSWSGALQAETIFVITGPTVIASGELVMYYPVWENWPMQLQVAPNAIPIDTAFTDHISLAAYDVVQDERGLVVTLWWQATGTPSHDYHVFVHLIDADGQIVTLPDGTTLQHDSLPQQRANSAFSTLWWQNGDLIPDQHIIPLPDPKILTDPTLSLSIGLYTFPNFERLPRPNGATNAQLPLNIRTIASDVAQ